MDSNEQQDLNQLRISQNTEPTVATSDSTLYWKEQSDEEFLQTLFENTLLSDNFTKKPDFDLGLGFDNLQLNYDSVSNPTAHSISSLLEIGNNAPPSTYVNSNTDTLLAITNESDLKSENKSTSQNVEQATLIENLLTTSDLLISKIDGKPLPDDDDKIFKRPSNDFLKFNPSSTTESKDDTQKITPLNYAPVENKNGFGAKQKISRIKKDDLKRDEKSTKIIKENKSSSAAAKQQYSGIIGEKNGLASNSNAIKLKRSRKRTKMVNGAQTNAGELPTTSKMASEKIIKQSLFDSNNRLFSKDPKLAKSRYNIEPLSKKFASGLTPTTINYGNSSSSSSCNSGGNFRVFNSIDFDLKNFNEKNVNTMTLNAAGKNLKRDEVDLDIKELSLLDLHSSEDDSSLDFSKRNGINRLSSNANGQISTNRVHFSPTATTNTNEKTSFLNEIISKRIKYSNPTVSTNNQDEQSVQTSSTSAPEDNKLDKFIQYLSKSLDSNIENFKTNTTTNHSKHKKDSSSTALSSSDLILSPPSPSSNKTQIKRKKKDNQNGNCPVILISIDSSTKTEPVEAATNVARTSSADQKSATAAISTKTTTTTSLTTTSSQEKDDSNRSQPSNSTETPNKDDTVRSTSIENDTLQHMKNLDINNDLTNMSKSSTIQITNGPQPKPSVIELPNKLNLNLNDINSRNYLWNLLKSHTPADELVQRFGSALHDKVSFWDLVQLKFKYSQNNHLKTTYEIIDDYTLLYSNMSALLERFVNEQTTFNNHFVNSNKKSTENSSRSRSSSRNLRKQSTSK